MSMARASLSTRAHIRWQQPNWRGRPWHETVLYELHVGLMGGFAGVARALPRLPELGITAIELMPIADFPERGIGAMTARCHSRRNTAMARRTICRRWSTPHMQHGMMIFLDVVYNHFGPDGNYLAALRAGDVPRRRVHALGTRDRFSPRRGTALLH